jgi:hypothetical protein
MSTKKSVDPEHCNRTFDSYRSRLRLAVVLGSAMLVLGSCAARPGGAADGLQRGLQWYAMAGGADLRETCAPGTTNRYRFIYNAVWDEQVRVYDLDGKPAGAGAELRSTVIAGAPRILQAGLSALAGRPGAAVAVTRLDAGRVAALTGALAEAGFATRPPADGVRLRSDDFYWLVSACIDGVWRLNAWRRGDPGFAGLGFDRLLFAADETGIPVNPPRAVDAAQRRLARGESPGERGRGDDFELVIRGGRLWGHAAWF